MLCRSSLVWLLSNSVSVGHSTVSCAVQGAYQKEDPKSDPNGGYVPVIDDCQFACEKTESCRFFTWLADTNGCELFDSEPELTSAPTAQSGPKTCPDTNKIQQQIAVNAPEAEAWMSKYNVDNKFYHLAKLVLDHGRDPEMEEVARKVREHAREGNLHTHMDVALQFLNGLVHVIDPQEAALSNCVITEDDLAELRYRGTDKNYIWPWEMDFFQGDMNLGQDGWSWGGGLFGRQKRAQAQVVPTGGTVVNDGRTTSDGASDQNGAGKPWKDALVKFCFDTSITAAARSAFQSAVRRVQRAVPGIRWQELECVGHEKCASNPAIFVTSSNLGCWSDVGMKSSVLSFGRSQVLNLQSPGCDDVGTTLHELLHALGMDHEQSRPDRDTYITVHEDNIQFGKASQFSITRGADCNRPYDILSLMHYGRSEFSVQRGVQPTITVKAAGYQVYTDNQAEWFQYQIGNRMGMSPYDEGQLADLYGCNEARTSCQPTSGGFLDFGGGGSGNTGGSGNAANILLVSLGLIAVAVIGLGACLFCRSTPQTSSRQSFLGSPQGFTSMSAVGPGGQFIPRRF
eukprot:TRINITY_DN24731_c0_g1_i1.p1 TRINITY_DN24731_c0_g1~~TRINITY_DN24731_c0_g1_i1.p1  ORF type:complete len:594 (+),score=77.92 TRINITY_DN24731_c0_g1_i1:75-1784(+)